MKKLIILLFILLLSFNLVGCNSPERTDSATDNTEFVIVEEGYMGGSPYVVFYHKDTKVMYITHYKSGMVTMLNPDGTPQLYEE